MCHARGTVKARRKTTDDHLPFVLAAFRGHGRTRSQLYWWMAEHHAELAAAKQAGRRVDWVSVTAELANLGISATDRKEPGKRVPLTTANVRRTWHRVDADVKAGVIVPRPETKPPAPPPAAAVARPASPPPIARVLSTSDAAAPDEDRPQIIEPGSRFRWTPAVDRAKPPKKES